MAACPGTARAQLISPGKLSTAHADLEGIRKCTTCHDLGQRGISVDKCLGCHEPIAVRLESKRGYHGRLPETVCGDCHAEHFGRDVRPVRFDTASFDHREAGMELVSAHARLSCRSCHNPSLVADPVVLRGKAPAGALGRTYLGLDPRCAGCHEADDPHDGQFEGEACTTCHGQDAWTPATGFDHTSTRYPLTGRHGTVSCVSCHGRTSTEAGTIRIRFTGLSFATCASCHADPHTGRMGPRCMDCHDTKGWSEPGSKSLESSFDHARTGYDLEGAHASATCSACHSAGGSSSRTVRIRFAPGTRTRRYPLPRHDGCVSCHPDVHEGDFTWRDRSTPCEDCHGQTAWAPSFFDPARHARETRYPLTGAHLAVACVDCHADTGDVRATSFAHEGFTCITCHAEDDPHEDAAAPDSSLGDGCAGCHDTVAWSDVGFDHASTEFPLRGRHAEASCLSCHARSADAPIRFTGLQVACVACHAADHPHGTQFEGRPCATCHDERSFRLESFDHSATRFPLDAAHANVSCGSCHVPEASADGAPVVRFTPIDTRCISCHAR